MKENTNVQNPKKKKSAVPLIIGLIALLIVSTAIAQKNNPPKQNDNDNIATVAVDSNSTGYSVLHGELLDTKYNDNEVIFKVKISSSFNNKATIDQNYYNVEDLILNQGCDKYSSIQYWAVADMSDGSESKVVSFTVPKTAISKIKSGSIVANQMGDYVDDLYILPSLKD